VKRWESEGRCGCRRAPLLDRDGSIQELQFSRNRPQPIASPWAAPPPRPKLSHAPLRAHSVFAERTVDVPAAGRSSWMFLPGSRALYGARPAGTWKAEVKPMMVTRPRPARGTAIVAVKIRAGRKAPLTHPLDGSRPKTRGKKRGQVGQESNPPMIRPAFSTVWRVVRHPVIVGGMPVPLFRGFECGQEVFKLGRLPLPF